MNKRLGLIIFVLCFAFIFSLGAVAIAASDYEKTDDIKVDNNVFKGEIGDVAEGVLVWFDIENFDSAKEYGSYVFEACEEKDIDIEEGTFTKREISKNTFGIVLNSADYEAETEYGVKGYIKDAEGTLYLSKTTAYFRFTETEADPFAIKLYGADVTTSSQTYVSSTNSVNKVLNTQYFVYAGDKLVGAANEIKGANNSMILSMNVVDRTVDENGNIPEGTYPLTVKTMSGLSNSATSEPFSYNVVHINDAAEFLEVGTNEDLSAWSHSGNYYVLQDDIDLTGVDWLLDRVKESVGQIGSGDTSKDSYFIIRYLTDTLDGRGHTVKASFDDHNSDEGKAYCVAGIFGKIATGACVRNIAFDIDIKYAGMQGSDVFNNPERNSALCQILAGKMENCYVKARAQTYSQYYRREVCIGYPVNFTMKNVVFDYQFKDKDGVTFEMADNANWVSGMPGYAPIWESMCINILDNVVMVAPRDVTTPVSGDSNNTCTNNGRYWSMDNFLKGIGGARHTTRLAVVQDAEILEDGTKLYETGDWGTMEFSETEMKICGKTVYTAE